MTLSTSLSEYIAAAFTGLWVQTHEQHEATAEIAAMCKVREWTMATWDCDRGLCVAGQAAAGTADPLAAIKSVNALATPNGSALLVLPNFHRYLQSTEIIQAITHQIIQGKGNRTFLVILSPVVEIPIELEKLFVVVEHDLPDRTQLGAIAASIASEPGEMPESQEDAFRLIDAAAGLTRYEAEGAFALSIWRNKRLLPETIWELKANQLKKSGLLTLHRGGERFVDLGGLDALKTFCQRAITSRRNGSRAKGVLLLGVPGTGKSALAKALGNEVGRPTITLDVGAIYGSLVGQSEANIRNALRVVDAMSPCILFVDEIEKALSGVASSGQTDSGVSARVFGSLLTWLSDHTSDVFFVGTCNDISKLPPEFSRAERFDGVFFIDLPSDRDRERIWPIHLKRYGVDADEQRPADRDWTGAEVQSCCRLSALLDVPLLEAARNVVPVAVTAAESVHRLRAWASGRCLDAGRPGVYTTAAQQTEQVTVGRRVQR